LFGFGFRAAPGWMTATLLLNLAGAVSQGLLAYGFKVFADAIPRAVTGKLVFATVWTTAFASLSWAGLLLAANLLSGLNSRVDLYASERLARVTSSTAGIAHLEDPAFARDLESVDENRFLIGYAPGQTLDLLQAVVRIAVIVGLLATIDPILAVLPVFGLAPFLFEGRAVRARERADEALAEPKRLANDIFALTSAAAPAKELRLFGLTSELRERHRRLADQVHASTVRVGVKAAAISALGWGIFSLGFLGAIALVMTRAAHGQATSGQLLMAVVLAQQTQSQVSQVAQALHQVLTTMKTAAKYLALEDMAARTRPTAGHQPAPASLRSGISFESVGFAYPADQAQVLQDVSLRLPAGKTVAVVGENGAGKTTLVKLLSRMYEPTSGTITVDGTDLRQFDAAGWRERVSAAFQDFTRFELLLGQSVGIGDLPNMSDQQAISAALERASASDIVAGLDGGLGTPLGRSMPGGQELSGGQWQKIAVSRAMMREPLLFLLDEPTASLDAATEHALFERYAAAAKRAASTSGAITVLISHRFSSVRMADLIVVLGHGRVMQVGTHAELMSAPGRYAELFELQAHAYR
jgi:ATP-binding cassette subfamily B protein